jgi:predicted DNA-binding transcriptional regulator YafY
MLYELKKAFNEHKNLEIMYLGKNNEVSQRVIRILELNEHTVKAYCYQRKALRFFKIENMLSGRVVMPYKKVKGA